jgi:hypothetical protein
MQTDQNPSATPPPSSSPATQTKYPWRATARTVFAAVVGALTLIPIIATTAKLDTIPAIAGIVAVTGTVTRILAIPEVDSWLRHFVPWLATTPREA